MACETFINEERTVLDVCVSDAVSAAFLFTNIVVLLLNAGDLFWEAGGPAGTGFHESPRRIETCSFQGSIASRSVYRPAVLSTASWETVPCLDWKLCAGTFKYFANAVDLSKGLVHGNFKGLYFTPLAF